MRTIYYPRWILCPDGTLLENGALAIAGNRIDAIGTRSRVGRYSGDRSVNLGQMLVLPGFINIHTHLEEGIVRGISREPNDSFATWFAKKNSRLKQASAAELEAAVRLGVRESLAQGITTVVDSSRRGVSAATLSQEPIRAWVIQELHADSEEDEQQQLHHCAQQLATSHPRIQLSAAPYALFSLSPNGHNELNRLLDQPQRRWLCHLAQSAEELQAFSEQCGDFYFQLTRNRPWPFGDNPVGSVNFALANNIIPVGGICVHCNYITGHELALLAARQVSVAISLRSTEQQGHKPLPLDIALKRGINLCAITESIADTQSLSLFDELFAIKQAFPHIGARELLGWVTTNPAAALGMQQQLGVLAPQAYADFIGVRFSHDDGSDVLEELLQEEPALGLVVVDGEEIIADY
jgi:cytosine/adenosine deaminase-related metal-dependent hydrolase